MKLSLFPKGGSKSGESSDTDSLEKLAVRIEAASRAADVAVKKAEATARKAEAAAAKAEVLIKQVQAMLDQIGTSVEGRALNSAAMSVAREVRATEMYSEEDQPKDRVVSESGIPLVAPFIVN